MTDRLYVGYANAFAQRLNETRPSQVIKPEKRSAAYFRREAERHEARVAQLQKAADNEPKARAAKPYVLGYSAYSLTTEVDLHYFASEKKLVAHYLACVAAGKGTSYHAAVWHNGTWYSIKLSTACRRVEKENRHEQKQRASR